MSIIICPMCIKGRIKVPTGNLGNEPLGACPCCDGNYVQRDPPEEWTKLEDLPEDTLRQMASLRHHCQINFGNGLLQFVEREQYPIPRDPDALLNMIAATTKLGNVLKSHNWIVTY